jgi:hypothetical protein
MRQGKTANAARSVDLATLIAAVMDQVAASTKPGARIFRHISQLLESGFAFPTFIV